MAMSQLSPTTSYRCPPSQAAPVVPRFITDMSAGEERPFGATGDGTGAPDPSVASSATAEMKPTATRQRDGGPPAHQAVVGEGAGHADGDCHVQERPGRSRVA